MSDLSLPPVGHAQTSEEMRLRVVAQTNGENSPLAQRALITLTKREASRRQEEERKSA